MRETSITCARNTASCAAALSYYPGRSGDVINRGGAKFSSTDFEGFLTACTGVKDAGICTHTGTAGFEEIWVGVVLEPSIDLAAFRRYIESDSQFGTNIDKLFVVQSIPRNELGKIQQVQLKEMLQSIYEDSPRTPDQRGD